MRPPSAGGSDRGHAGRLQPETGGAFGRHQREGPQGGQQGHDRGAGGPGHRARQAGRRGRRGGHGGQGTAAGGRKGDGQRPGL